MNLIANYQRVEHELCIERVVIAGDLAQVQGTIVDATFKIIEAGDS